MMFPASGVLSGLWNLVMQHVRMGFITSLKRTFNVGGCAISIVTDARIVRQGGTVAGEVEVRGGGYTQEARALRITLVEFWTESRGSGKNRRTVTVTRQEATETLACPFAITAGQSVSLPFRLALPPDARLSEPGESTGWRLVVEMDVPGAIDPSGSNDLRVEPAEALLELVKLWGEVLHWPEIPARRSWDPKARSTRFRFNPPPELGQEFDFLDLACAPLHGGDWQASMSFDLQEKGLLDRLAALVNLDKAASGMLIPAAALSGDQAARAVCARELVGIMQGIIAKRG
jgi:hypothetical protein